MKTEPTRTQSVVAGIVGLVFAGMLGAWLGMSYFGIWTSDAKVSVKVDEVGDAIGPGAKIRYHGIIVGRVLKLEQQADDSYELKLLVDSKHAKSIPDDATARILPGTVFGSEYVELLSENDADDNNYLQTGDVLLADGTDSTLRLMEAFDSAERLVSAIDAEDLNRVTGKLAPALDGHGDDIKEFLVRADIVVSNLNDNLPNTWQTLSLAPSALDTLGDITPQLVSAAENSQTTMTTIVEKNKKFGQLLTDSKRTIDRGTSLLDQNHDIILPFVARLDRLTNLVADNASSLQDVLTNFAAVGHNGAGGVDENAIQMIGTIGLDLLDAYTAEDCTRYSETLIASNCGDPVPEPETETEAASSADATALADQLNQLLLGSPEPAATTQPAPTPTATPSATSSGVGGLLSLLGLGGAPS